MVVSNCPCDSGSSGIFGGGGGAGGAGGGIGAELGSMFDGISYDYETAIQTPQKLGVASGSSWHQLKDNTKAWAAYSACLLEGGGEACPCWVPNPSYPDTSFCGLGAVGFVPTAGHVKDATTDKTYPRSLYVSNVPVDNPIGSGLIAGMEQAVSNINVKGLLGAFSASSTPTGQYLNLPIRTKNCPQGCCGQGWVANKDIVELSNKPGVMSIIYAGPKGCRYTKKEWADIVTTAQSQLAITKPAASFGASSVTRESFQIKLNPASLEIIDGKMPDDPVIQLYFGALGLLGLYIFAKLFYPRCKLN